MKIGNNGDYALAARIRPGFHPNHEEPGKSWCFADTDDSRQFWVPMWACRKIIAGPVAPAFSSEECRRWPNKGDRIVLLPDDRPSRPGQAPRVYRWGYQRFYDLAQAEVENRPIYRVAGENRFQGKMMSNGKRCEEIAAGTMEELQFRFPRGVRNDPLGTEEPYRRGPCQRINHWYLWKDGDWQACEDPRPSSAVKKATPEADVAENTVNAMADLDDALDKAEKASLEDLAAAAGGKNRNPNDPKGFKAQRRQELAV